MRGQGREGVKIVVSYDYPKPRGPPPPFFFFFDSHHLHFITASSLPKSPPPSLPSFSPGGLAILECNSSAFNLPSTVKRSSWRHTRYLLPLPPSLASGTACGCYNFPLSPRCQSASKQGGGEGGKTWLLYPLIVSIFYRTTNLTKYH